MSFDSKIKRNSRYFQLQKCTKDLFGYENDIRTIFSKDTEELDSFLHKKLWI